MTGIAVAACCVCLALTGCQSNANNKVLVFGGTSIGEQTLVAPFHELAVSTREPNVCIALRGLTGRNAYNALLRIEAENVDVTPTLVPAEGGDWDRAGDLLVEQCQKYYENRRH